MESQDQHIRPLWQWGARIMLGSAAILLIYGFLQYVRDVIDAIHFPFGLDYGEGIVWQQMRLLMSGQGYGSIEDLPAIVFHYPPLFHAMVAILADAIGMDQLAAGRLLSISSTIVTGCSITLIVARQNIAEAERVSYWICGLLAGLISFSFWPVLLWSKLMRVDMLSIMFSFVGLYFGLRALTRPTMIHFAALCFVAAIYTKQTAIAAPTAVFGTLLFLRPRTAWAGIATSIVIGLAALGMLMWLTEGGFVRHILLYNINRIEVHRLSWIGWMVRIHFLYFFVIAIGISVHLHRRFLKHGGTEGKRVRQRLLESPSDAGFVMILVYLLLATFMLAMVIKSGSWLNYFLEWGFIIALLTGFALVDSALAATGKARDFKPNLLIFFLPFAIALQAYILPNVAHQEYLTNPARERELNELVALTKIAPRPVISDDMVILLRSNKTVQWEPAIFAELASIGAWDERPFINKIMAREFAFFITEGGPNDPLYNSRYNKSVSQAIDTAYPVKRRLAGYQLHFPSGPLPDYVRNTW